MKKLLFIFTLTILTICMAWAQSQIIGSYPSMDGGFENESGTLATASSISSAQSYWTTQDANKGVIQNTGGRSGPKYVQYSQSGTTHKRLQSPTANVTAASHVVQFYYQGDMDGTIGGDIRGAVSAVGTSSPQYGAYITSANTGTVWTKYTAVVTTTGTPANGVGIVSTRNTCTFYIDDFVVYPGSSVDVTAPNSPGTASVSEATTNSLKISWVAASGGVDGGGYLLIRYSSQPGSGNDPNVNGIYAIGNSIGSGIVTYIGTDTYFTDNNLSPNTTYWYRIYTVDKAFNYSSAQSVSGSTTGEQVSAPTTQASNITFSSIESTQMTVSWTNGNGTKRIAKMNTSSSFTNPSDGSDPTADDSWNNSGEQVIYNGSGNSVTVTNLSASTTYWVRVYEYNGSGTGTKYLTATATNNPNSQTTSTPPPSAPTATAATNVSYNKFTANWNSVSGATKYYLDVYTKSGGATDLIISEYVEGSSYNKAIELYNGTGSSIDLSNYSLKKQTNGAGDFGNELTLSGTLANNDTYVIVSNAGTPNLSGNTWVDLATNSQALNFNGNDAVALYKNGVQLDVVGVVNQTSDWGKDVTLVRKSSVTSPTTSYSTDQWDSFAIDTFTYLGSHTMDSSTSYVSGYQNKDVGNVTSYEVSGLNSNTTYYYVVRAYNDNGSSANSNEISVTTTSATLPVELSAFTANINSQGGITLMWATQSETGVNGFYVNRAMVNDLAIAERISPLIPGSNTSHQQVYVYSDKEVYEPGTYYYWLEIQDIDGVVNYYGSRSVTFGGNGSNGTPDIPLVTGIRSIYPNPFNPSATIMYELEQPANLNIEIYNNRGQMVRSFAMGQKEQGRYKLLWDGTDNSGYSCGTGIYFIKMQVGKETFVKKAALVK